MTDKPEPIFKPGEGYTTRGYETGLSPYPARVYANDTGGTYPIHGAILQDGEWKSHVWTSEGRSNLNIGTPLDLMPPKPREVWIWSWDEAGLDTEAYFTKSNAGLVHNPNKGHAVKFREVMDDD